MDFVARLELLIETVDFEDLSAAGVPHDQRARIRVASEDRCIELDFPHDTAVAAERLRELCEIRDDLGCLNANKRHGRNRSEDQRESKAEGHVERSLPFLKAVHQLALYFYSEPSTTV